jgi:uncharacterized protein
MEFKLAPLKLSQFAVPLHNYPSPGYHLLYHTLTRALIKMDDNAWSVLKGLPSVPAVDEVKDWLASLAKAGFVVPKEANEGERYIQRLEGAKDNTDRLNVTLSLVQSCNFGCGYCYQGGDSTTHDGRKITRDGGGGGIQTGQIIAFLKSECEARRVKVLGLTAYGGEPLLNKAALLEIASTMQTYCHEQGMRWAFGMVSNGSLLNQKTVLELKRYGFASVQITIDGNRETHDASRPWKSPKGRGISTYDTILRNLDGWAGLINTDVLCVVSKSNIDAAHELIDTLADKGYAKKRVRMLFSPISLTYDNATISQIGAIPHPEPEAEIAAAITQLTIHAAQCGLIADLRPTGTWCAVIRANGQHITITPDGTIYSCALFIGRDDRYETGHIAKRERGGLDTSMKQFDYPDECKKCPYLPICANCRAEALSQTGDILGANSQQARYDVTLPALIKAHYDLQVAPADSG